MRRVAFLISADVASVGPGMRKDAFEMALQLDALRPPCAARGLALEPAVWDAPDTDWSGFDAAVIAATWDYMSKADAFLAALDRIAQATPLFNPPGVVRWNIDKGYMAELAARGAAIVPTLFRERAAPATLAAAFEALGAEEIVVKPRVGAGAWRQARLKRGEPTPSAEALPPGPCLIQPFVASVAREGEASLMLFDGVFSHAVVKRPKPGDYRVQSEYGAREEVCIPSAAERAAAEAALGAAAAILGEPPLYARVDLVAGADDAPLLMELELIEPYYYPEQGPGCGEMFAAALERRLSGSL